MTELAEREELAQIATNAQTPEPLPLEHQEGDQGQADGDVDIARGGAQLLDPTDRWHEADPVAEQDEQEEPGEDGDIRHRARPGQPDPEVTQRLVEPLEHILPTPRDHLATAGHQDGRDEHDHDDDPHRQDRGGDADVEGQQLIDRRGGGRVQSQTTCGAGNSSVPLM